MKFPTFVLTLALLAGCSTVQQHSIANRPDGDGYVSAGDVVVRVQIAEDLPNAFGKADLFGRTRDRGFTEVRYMGLSAAGMPVFRRRDVDIMTNETTMSRTGFHAATVNVSQTPSGANATTVGVAPVGDTVQALPSDTT